MTVSIQDILNKFKSLVADDSFFFGVLIVLISIASFGLGRWSVVPEPAQLASVSIEQPQKATAHSPTAPTNGVEAGVVNSVPNPSVSVANTEASVPLYVGSKNGSKFHLLTCPGAGQIKEENKIFFSSKDEAYKKGYTEAGNCKGI